MDLINSEPWFNDKLDLKEDDEWDKEKEIIWNQNYRNQDKHQFFIRAFDFISDRPSNAFKYGDTDKLIKLKFSIESDPRLLTCEVINEGQSISEDIKKTLFNKNFTEPISLSESIIQIVRRRFGVEHI